MKTNKLLPFMTLHHKLPCIFSSFQKKHIATVNDFSEQEANLLGHMILTAKKLAHELGIAEDGYRLNMNCNHLGGQTVFHTHLHLLAGRQFGWPPG